jgi:SAM-dependent methyltransferase
MNIREYEKMYRVEDDNWWYVGLRELTHAFINKFSKRKIDRMFLDAGCGTGGMLAECSGYNAVGLDISEESIKFCKLRNLHNLVRGSISDIPFKKNAFNIIISLDVIYHLNVPDDMHALKEIHRIMTDDALLLLNLHAYNFLRSAHDIAFHTRQRYTLRDVKEKVERSGFIVERITYRNTVLFPLIAAIRIIKKYCSSDRETIESDMRALPFLLNKFLSGILKFENRLIMLGMNFPFGLSIFCVARKK